MRPGDLVVYIGKPEGFLWYGRMQFKGPCKGSDPRLLECIACPGSSHAHSYFFEAHELELASRVAGLSS
jgi:hypothetical protein